MEGKETVFLLPQSTNSYELVELGSWSLMRHALLLMYIRDCCVPISTPNCYIQVYCLALYGSTLWNISSSSLKTIEVAFNNILRQIWSVPQRTYTFAVFNNIFGSRYTKDYFPEDRLCADIIRGYKLMFFSPLLTSHTYSYVHFYLLYTFWCVCVNDNNNILIRAF